MGMDTKSLAIIQETQALTGWKPGQIDVIKDQLAPGISDAELFLFGTICQQTGLNPFSRQVYAIMRSVSENVDGQWIKRKKMTVQTGIDGYRLIAARTGQLAGIDDAEYDSEDGDQPKWARVTVYRMVQGQRCPFTAKARWSEYVQKDGKGNVSGKWKDMPFLMLAKVAEALALRKAFPADLSGVYTHEEMMQADSEYQSSSVTITPSDSHPGASQAHAPNEATVNLKAWCDEQGITREVVASWAKEQSHDPRNATALWALINNSAEAKCQLWIAQHGGDVTMPTVTRYKAAEGVLWPDMWESLSTRNPDVLDRLAEMAEAVEA